MMSLLGQLVNALYFELLTPYWRLVIVLFVTVLVLWFILSKLFKPIMRLISTVIWAIGNVILFPFSLLVSTLMGTFRKRGNGMPGMLLAVDRAIEWCTMSLERLRGGWRNKPRKPGKRESKKGWLVLAAVLILGGVAFIQHNPELSITKYWDKREVHLLSFSEKHFTYLQPGSTTKTLLTPKDGYEQVEMYEMPDLDSAVVGSIVPGNPIYYMGEVKRESIFRTWYKVYYGGENRTGWVSSIVVRIVDSKAKQ